MTHAQLLALAISLTAIIGLLTAGVVSGSAGDVNCDGETNSLDALHVLQLTAGLTENLPCPDNADVDLSGTVDSLDAAVILQYSAGFLRSLSPDKPTTTRPPTRTPRPTATPVYDERCNSDWPEPIEELVAWLPVPEGLCLVRIPGNDGVAHYDGSIPAAVCPGDCGAPVGGELASILHEVCHAYQHQAFLESGVPWYDTPAGLSFIEATGWERAELPPPMPPASESSKQPGISGWNDDGVLVEPGWSLYINPAEDHAQVCAIWFDNLYDIVPASEQGYLETYAPARHAWAKDWLPTGPQE